MEENKNVIEVHIHDGGQFNLAMDNSYIQALQNNRNGIDEDHIQALLDVINGEEYIHKIPKDEKENYEFATEEEVEKLPNEIIEVYKRQLSTRLNGNESKLQIIGMFLREVEDTLQTGKRYGVLPMFSYIPRGVEKAYLFLDDCVMPFDAVEVQEYYWDAYEKYVIDTKYYHMVVVLFGGKMAYLELGYNLSFPDVTERLYGFGKVKQLENAKKIEVLLQDTNRRIYVDMLVLGKEKREEQIAITNYWIEQMEMIDVIEKYFRIKFYLPQKATEENYQAIYTLHNSVSKRCTSTFPAIPMERDFFRKSIKIEGEMLLNCGIEFMPIELFGYHFEPIAAYLTECTLIWKKKIRAWEVDEGGVPVRVEFVCSKT